MAQTRTIADLIEGGSDCSRGQGGDGGEGTVDRRREARFATTRDKQRYPDLWGYTEPYGWAEDKARQYSVPERHNFGPFIRRHGFNLA